MSEDNKSAILNTAHVVGGIGGAAAGAYACEGNPACIEAGAAIGGLATTLLTHHLMQKHEEKQKKKRRRAKSKARKHKHNV
jgi:hypothetical protein